MMSPASQALSVARNPRAGVDAVLDAFDSLRVAVTVFDSGDRLIYCNRHFNYIFRAMPDREKLIGKTYGDLVRLEVQCGEIAGHEMAEGLDGFVARRHAQLHGGEYKPQDIHLASGRIIEIKARRAANGGFVALWSDVTSLRNLSDLSVQTEKQRLTFPAELVQRLNGGGSDAGTPSLLRTMSHELKSPLNAIIGFSDLLRTSPDRYGPAQVKEYAEMIYSGGHNLLRLINQILDLSKIAAGHFTLERKGVDAGDVLLATRERFEDAAAAKSVALTMDDTGGGLIVHADENALGTMISHLVDNAVSFIHPEGEVRLSLTRAGGRIRIVVADNGPGVDAAELQRILLPFEQAGAGNRGRGAGLGLTLVKALAELHGGTLHIHSTLGEGFTATLELPAA